MNTIDFVFNHHYQWHQRESLYFKGFFFDRDSKHFHVDTALDVLEKLDSVEHIKKHCLEIDGPFSMVKEVEDSIIITNGVMGIFPVFYTFENGNWHVSDSTQLLSEKKNSYQINNEAIAEFSAGGFVLGKETLLKDIYKSRAGEVIVLKSDGSIESHIYNYWLPKKFWDDDLIDLKVKLVYRLKNVIKRLIVSLKDRTAVVPLSGGYDSRLILCLLKHAGLQKVICFTYGKPSAESELSRRVAEKLGYPWLFVDYRDTDPTKFLDDPVFHEYCKYAGNHYSMPYLQEYFAVKYLKENNLIPSDSVFLPGHGGDFLAGAHIKRAACKSRDPQKLPKRILKKYYPFMHLQEKDHNQILARLQQWFADYNPPQCAEHDEYSVFIEDWDVKEKRSKFIFQSIHTYVYFGYAFRLPLWHIDLRNLFREVPFELRKNKRLFDELLEDEFFKPMGVYFESAELKHNRQSVISKVVKKIIKPIAPNWAILFNLRQGDWVCYEKFTSAMEQQLKKEGIAPLQKINSYNARICKWYLHQILRKVS